MSDNEHITTPELPTADAITVPPAVVEAPTHPAANDNKKTVAVIGAGLSGLTTAKYLIDQGYDVDIYDGKNRTGGKIHTRKMGDGPNDLADEGAEYIDSNQTQILKLCDDLGVKYIQANDSMSSRYHLKSGKVISEDVFKAAYKPISSQVYADSKSVAADPTGAHAQHLDGMSVTQYLEELNANVADTRNVVQKIFQKKPGIDPEILHMAAQAFAAERMRPASQISALQFMHETACESGDLIPSDCKYRIEGGTQRLTDALEAHLKANGARIHLGTKLTGMEKAGEQKKDGIHLTFDNNEGPKHFDEMAITTHAHAITKLNGIENFLGEEDIDTLQRLQYTSGTKITISRKQPITNNGFFISNLGYEVWNRAPNDTVFMIGDDLSSKYKPRELMQLVMEDYARAHKSTVEKEFDTTKVVFGGPSEKEPCYPAAGQGQYLKLRKLSETYDHLAAQGIGIAGTYLPGEMHMDDKSESANRMGHGVESAYRTATIMANRDKTQEQDQPEQAPAPLWVDRIHAQQQSPVKAAAAAR